jgi:hypothetical protein
MANASRGLTVGIMTKIDGVPDRDSVKPGMAYFAGTGPFGETCGTCLHRGCIGAKGRRVNGCAVFKSLTGRHGCVVNQYNHSCKYFEPLNPPQI